MSTELKPLQPLENELLTLSSATRGERMLEIYDRVKFFRTELARIQGVCETLMMGWIAANGDLEAGNGVRYYVGKEKKTKCMDQRQAVEALISATAGDLDKFCETLSANAIKHGAAKKLLAPETYGVYFTTEESDDLKEGEPKKKLIRMDEKFLPTGGVSVPTGASPQPNPGSNPVNAGAVSGSKADPPATAAAPVPEQATGAEVPSAITAPAPSEKGVSHEAGEGPTLAGPSPKAAKCPNLKCKATLAPDGVCPNCGPIINGPGPYDHWLTMTPEEVKITWLGMNQKTFNAQWKLFPKNVKDRINSILKG